MDDSELDEVAIASLCAPYLERRGILAGHVMTREEIDAEMLFFLGNDITLKAVKKDELLLLDDGSNGQVDVSNITALELMPLLFDWAVFAGLTCLNFDEYMEMYNEI